MINSSRSSDRRDRTAKSTSLVRVAPKSKARFSKPKTRYEELKAVVQNYFESRVAAGAALKEIHDDKLYKEEYKTFEEFCVNHCGMSRAQAYRQMELPAMAESLSVSKVETKITNESQARALSEVKETKREAVLARIEESGEPITAKSIIETAKPRELKKKSVPRQEPQQPDEPLVIDVRPEPVNSSAAKHCPTCTCG